MNTFKENETHVMACQISEMVSKTCVPPIPDGRNSTNRKIGFEQRVARVAGVEHISEDKLNFVKSYVARWLAENYRGPRYRPVDERRFSEWLASRTYGPARRAELQATWEKVQGNYLTKGVNYQVNKTFIKREFYPAFKPPRLINSRVDEFKVIAGPALQALEEYMTHLPMFVKHIRLRDRPRYIKEKLSGWETIVVTDYSRFESSMRREVMNVIEAQLYREYGLPEEMIRVFLKTQVLVGDNFRGRTSARMSGDMTTSLGNGFTNFIIMKAVCAYYGVECDGVVEGDDGVFGVGRVLEARLFKEFGFDLDCVIADSVETAGFCSSWWSPDDTLLVDPVRLFRLGWSCKCPPAMSWEKRQELFRGTCTCLAYEAGGCPLFWAVAKKYAKAGRGRLQPDWWEKYVLDAEGIETKMVKGWMVFECSKLPIKKPSKQAREIFSLLFDFPVALQHAVEKSILGGKGLDLPELVTWCENHYPDLITNAMVNVQEGALVRDY